MSRGAFEETGLAEPLAGAAAALGWDGPVHLQASAIPVIRRGGNVVLRGASGAGVTFAWAAGVLERTPSLPSDERPRVLVLCATTERAAQVADVVARIASLATGEDGAQWRTLRVRALAPGWSFADADVLVAGEGEAGRAVREARLKLGGTGIVVVEQPLDFAEGGIREGLDAIMTALPREAQRIFVTAAYDDALDELVDAHARRALSIPARPQDPVAAPEVTRVVGVVIADESEKLAALCAALSERNAEGDVVLARSRARAASLALALDRRGLGSGAGGPAVAAWGGEDRGTIAYDVPFDAAGFDALAGDAPLVLATPTERRHLSGIARDAGVRLATRSRPAPAGAAEAWRGRVERALEEEDIDAQLALLEPLFGRHSAHEVAAALSALLRRRTPPEAAVAAEARRGASSGPPPPPSFVRLFISAGQRDGLRPADLVGAIAGETGLPGDRIGRIDIRDTFSVAEVDTSAADQVIRALNGTTLRGRSIRVDYDRRATPGAVRRSRPPRPGS